MDREKVHIWLIGEVSSNISVYNGLPTARDMLKQYFFKHSLSRKSKADSIIDVAKELRQIWEFFNQKAINGDDVVKKIKKVIDKFEHLKKAKTDASPSRSRQKKIIIAPNRGENLTESFHLKKMKTLMSIQIRIVNCNMIQKTPRTPISKQR